MLSVRPEFDAKHAASLAESADGITLKEVLEGILDSIELSAKQGSFGKSFDGELQTCQTIQEELCRRGFQVEAKSSNKITVYWE